ncbi:MAG: exodeoxyribonuclease VII large subunit [Rhodospirillales bacterium]|nr:exodeoxyribonuclease VII large subunit [Rhodospirillales bacterium]
MEETLPNDGGDHNLPIFSVGEISQALKAVVEESFAWVRVRGEISGFKRAASGHLYMALKDPDAVLDAVCWRGTAGRLGVAPEDGMEVVATGRITTYAGRSKYQIVIESMEIAGEGALLKLLQERKRRLADEGLFDEIQKRPIPFLPEVIGVVTSPTGAVIRDILHRLDDRFPCHVILWPVLVQGEGAAEKIAKAISGFNQLPADGAVPRPDVLIVARGGGSLEDLWAFNEEIVARAAADGEIPLISAVGHETDFTLIDFVSDLRAPTPTAAAEMAVPVRLELLAQVMDDGSRLIGATNRLLADRNQRLEGLARGLPNLRRIVEDTSQRLDDWAERLANGLKVGLERRSTRLAALAARMPVPHHQLSLAGEKLAFEARSLTTAARSLLSLREARFSRGAALLDSCSYERILDRGFALAIGEKEELLTAASKLGPGMDLRLRFHDGETGITVKGSENNGSPPAKQKKQKRKSTKTDDRQGNLL